MPPRGGRDASSTAPRMTLANRLRNVPGVVAVLTVASDDHALPHGATLVVLRDCRVVERAALNAGMPPGAWGWVDEGDPLPKTTLAT